ncbi:MAG TPA: hypothetical protein VKB47_04660 [Terracidiphilus sp.]|nr:hypothetical protein [Terracidiphilus sp.]
MLLATRVVVVLFFTGLAGCAVVVALSWISIFGDGFSDWQNARTDSDLAAMHEESHHASRAHGHLRR